MLFQNIKFLGTVCLHDIKFLRFYIVNEPQGKIIKEVRNEGYKMKMYMRWTLTFLIFDLIWR